MRREEQPAEEKIAAKPRQGCEAPAAPPRVDPDATARMDDDT